MCTHSKMLYEVDYVYTQEVVLRSTCTHNKLLYEVDYFDTYRVVLGVDYVYI